jgi:hypothetical protein
MSRFDNLFPTDETERAKSEGNPFAIPDLWRPSSFSSDPSQESTLFSFNFTPPELPPAQHVDTVFRVPPELKLPILSGLQSNVWPQLFPHDDEFRSDPTTASSMDDDNVFSDITDGDGDRDMDIWMDPDTAIPPEKPQFYTWDSFLVEGANEPLNGYITEAGPGVLDSALVEGGEDGAVVRTDVFCTVSHEMG